MKTTRYHTVSAATRIGQALATPVMLGVIAGVAVVAGATLARKRQQRTRRYADHAVERRKPMSLFTPRLYFNRRRIDRTGNHPLFERRQSVYDSY